MFAFGRDLRAYRKATPQRVARNERLAGDTALHDLLDLSLLTAEAAMADVEAGRVSQRDPAAAALAAAAAWREVARRAGDPAALRKAASHAEAAARQARGAALTKARCEQARCALLGAELFGDDSLAAAARMVLGLAAGDALADALRAGLDGRDALAAGDIDAALAATQAMERPLTALAAVARGRDGLRIDHADQTCVRADLLLACAGLLRDGDLAVAAMRDLGAVRDRLDPAYAPLTCARIDALRGAAMVLTGEIEGEPNRIIDGVDVLTAAVDLIPADHSPLDWARLHASLGLGLQSLGESTTSERAFEQAVTAFDRARALLAKHPALQLTAVVANNRAVCLARCAELTGDLAVLDAAEAALKTELVQGAPRRDPVAWAITQVNLARLYEARVGVTGRDRGQRAAAAVALVSAIDVFAEEGLRSLTAMAQDALERLRAASPAG